MSIPSSGQGRSGTGAVDPARWRWGYSAAGWALLFAGLHVYWALGGRAGLASSAGRDLAVNRPLWFVVFGLWGVALVLLALAALGVLLARTGGRGRPAGTGAGGLLAGTGARGLLARLARPLGWLVGGVLLLRGVWVQVLLLTGAGHVARTVGPEQVHASLVWWDPWFVAGGLVFLLAARQQCLAGRRGTRSP